MLHGGPEVMYLTPTTLGLSSDDDIYTHELCVYIFSASLSNDFLA